MRMLNAFLLTATVVSLLTGCTTKGQSTTQLATNFLQRQHITSTTDEIYPPKNAKTVAVFTNEKAPISAYRIIGVAKISKYNMLGLPRPSSTMNEMMKKLAASIGGDGIMNVSNNEEGMEAKVIAFHKILI